MLTICWTASSWPTTRFSRVFSKDSASLPVLVGSRTFRNRLISVGPSFFFFLQIPVTSEQCEMESLTLCRFSIQEEQIVCQYSHRVAPDTITVELFWPLRSGEAFWFDP